MSDPHEIVLSDVVLENRFNHHPPDEVRVIHHEAARRTLKDAAATLMDLVPPGRELALAITKLEEAMFWANAGIARS